MYARHVGNAYYRCAAPRVGAVHTCFSLRACVFVCVRLLARACVTMWVLWGESRLRSQLVGRAALATLVPLTRVAVLDMLCLSAPRVCSASRAAVRGWRARSRCQSCRPDLDLRLRSRGFSGRRVVGSLPPTRRRVRSHGSACACARFASAVCLVSPCETGVRGLDVNPVGLTSTCAYALVDLLV